MFKDFVKMSNEVGARADYIQGGGGNTSVKYGDGLMAVKASGFRLTDITQESGFAVVVTATLEDVTVREGFKPLRPSVEASFHALLKKYVIHTHPVYANLALCSIDSEAVVAQVLKDFNYITVPYINPGAELAAVIKEKLQPDTDIILLRNHGLIVTSDTADGASELHRTVNDKFAKYYSVTKQDFDAFSEMLAKPLYPDQQVYLTLTQAQSEIEAATMFIHTTLIKNGKTARAMGTAAQDFIANWESEAYRKSILK